MFVERTLTARKGNRRATLRLRVFAPDLQRPDHPCSFELTVDRKEWWPPHRVFYGADSVQALISTLRVAVLQLQLFERDTGMRIPAMDWADLVALAFPFKDLRARLSEIKAEIREEMREYRESVGRKRRAAAASRTPRAAAASRTPRAAAASRSRSPQRKP